MYIDLRKDKGSHTLHQLSRFRRKLYQSFNKASIETATERDRDNL